MNRLAAFVLLTLGGVATGQSVKLPPEVKVTPGLVVVAAETEAAEVLWYLPDGGPQMLPGSLLRDTKTAVGFCLTPGRFRLLAIVGKGDKAAYAVTTLVVGDAPEPGPGPGPGPGPKPDPVDPDPFLAPGETAGGLKVLFILETSDTTKLPRWQTAIATSPVLSAYLNSHCMDAPDGKTKAWRVWDKDVSPANEAAIWQKGMAAPRKSLPWLLVGNGTKGYSGPLPATVDETIKLLQRFGGN